jgi:hypothetical protein
MLFLATSWGWGWSSSYTSSSSTLSVCTTHYYYYAQQHIALFLPRSQQQQQYVVLVNCYSISAASSYTISIRFIFSIYILYQPLLSQQEGAAAIHNFYCIVCCIVGVLYFVKYSRWYTHTHIVGCCCCSQHHHEQYHHMIHQASWCARQETITAGWNS